MAVFLGGGSSGRFLTPSVLDLSAPIALRDATLSRSVLHLRFGAIRRQGSLQISSHAGHRQPSVPLYGKVRTTESRSRRRRDLPLLARPPPFPGPGARHCVRKVSPPRSFWERDIPRRNPSSLLG